MGEVFFVVIMFLLWLIPFAVFKLWMWFWLFVSITAVFAVFELTAKLTTGKTLSQQFWAWSSYTEKILYVEKKPNIWKAWTIVGCMITGWLMLMLHLVYKII